MADFKLGRIKFKWRGDWATSTSYLIDDVVKYGGNTYVVTANHTSPANENLFYTSPGTYTSYFSLQAESLFFKGTYANSTWYKLNDLVSYGQRLYRCTTGHTSSSTVLDSTKFELYQDGVDYKGDWAGSTYYKVNDVVKFGGTQYKCTTAHTSGSGADDFDQSNFTTFVEGQKWQDSYNSGTVYKKGDIVSYGGYTYIYVNTEEAAGNTPTDDDYWDVITTGYNNTGEYSHGTTYKTGDVVRYGGNSYVAIRNFPTDSTIYYPADINGNTNSTYWELVVKGFAYQSSAYDSATTYNIGDVVRYTSSTYILLKDRVTNVTPGTDGTTWQLIAQGDSGAVMNTRGDMIIQDASQATRLPIGVRGAVLTTDGTDPSWSNPEGANVIYVANSGSDSNPGTQFLPYKTIKYALSQSSSGDIVDIDTIAGGTGGTPGTYDASQSATDGSGTGAQVRVTTDGSSTPTVSLINGGSGHAAGDTITFNGADIGGSSNMTFNVKSASIGDVVYVKNGVYREQLPLVVPAGVTVQGESLRGTEVRPATSTGTAIKTVTQSGGVGGTAGTYNYVTPSATSSSGKYQAVRVNVVQDGSSAPTVTIYHGGYDFSVSDTITIPASSIGNPGSNLTLTVASLENNDASNMWLLNNLTNMVSMTFKGLTATPTGKGTGNAAVVSLDPSGSITTTSPYIQNCTSSNANATGIEIDGNLHSAGNKSILCNDFTQINSDGIGCHAIAGGRGEMVSVFTYYCDKSFYAHSGGFIRALNCSSAYGEKGAEADGTLASETPVSVTSRGQMLKYDTTQFVGAATESDVSDCITTQGQGTATISGAGGASATIFRTNISTDHFHIESITGSFVDGETLTITKEDSSTFQVKAASSNAQTGQTGALIAVDSADGTLGSANVITLGANVQFAGDSTYYRVSAVSETNTSNEQATIRLTAAVTSGNAIADNTATTITSNFSNVRLTGHDFLDIGTGDFTSTNYPGGPSQPADQSDEVNELNGGRVYFSSTDQRGDFRVGDLFKIEQSTGVATLNADAFDLSGLNELQLGSIGAELGATINEFSTDETMSNDANTAVPTERAVVGYTQRDKMGTGHFVPPTGTTAERPTGGSLFTGGIRYNSSLVTWEGYNGTQWTGLGGGNPWSTITFDGSTVPTVAANDRNFVDCSSNAGSINLPASPQSGDQVRFIDMAGNADTNNITINRNGKKIQGLEENMTVDRDHAAFGLVYTGTTYGWVLIEV